VIVGPALTHLAFEVDDLERFAREAAAKGYPSPMVAQKNFSGSADRPLSMRLKARDRTDPARHDL